MNTLMLNYHKNIFFFMSVIFEIQKNNIPKSVEESFKFFFFLTDSFLILSLLIILIYNIYFKNFLKFNQIIFLTTINIYIYLFSLMFCLNCISGIYFFYLLNYEISSNYTFILRLIVLLLYTIFLILLKQYSKMELNKKNIEFLFLVSCTAFALLLLFKCNNFITFIILLEIYSLLSYILIIYKTNSLFSTEGGLKYFITGAFSTGIAVLGLLTMYLGAASYNYGDLEVLSSSWGPFFDIDPEHVIYLKDLAQKNIYCFELQELINKTILEKYQEALFNLNIFQPILDKTQQEILNWNKELINTIFSKVDPLFEVLFPGNDYINENNIFDFKKQTYYWKKLFFKCNDLTLNTCNNDFFTDSLFILEVKTNFFEFKNQIYNFIKRSPIYFNTFIKVYSYLHLYTFQDISNFVDGDINNNDFLKNKSSIFDIDTNKEKFKNILKILNEGRWNKIRLDTNKNEWENLISIIRDEDIKNAQLWQSFWNLKNNKASSINICVENLRKYPMLGACLERLTESEITKLSHAYYKFKSILDQNDSLILYKQKIIDMISNYVLYLQSKNTTEYIISKREVLYLVDKAFRDESIWMFYPDLITDEMRLSLEFLKTSLNVANWKYILLDIKNINSLDEYLNLMLNDPKSLEHQQIIKSIQSHWLELESNKEYLENIKYKDILNRECKNVIERDYLFLYENSNRPLQKKNIIVIAKRLIDKETLEKYCDSLLDVESNTELFDKSSKILNFQALGLMLIFISIGLKIGIAPFHMWSLDAYEGTDTWVMAFLSIIPKFILLFFLINLINYFKLENFINIKIVAYYCIIFSSIIGAFGGILQYSLKRMLVYSAISNTAFFMSYFIIGSVENEHSVLLYIFSYFILMLGIFSCVFMFKDRCEKFLIENYYNLTGIASCNSILSKTINIYFFSLMGIPPLFFFISKFYILNNLFSYHHYLLVLILLLVSCVNIFYYLKIIKITELSKTENNLFFYKISRKKSFILAICFFINILLLIIPAPIIYNIITWIVK